MNTNLSKTLHAHTDGREVATEISAIRSAFADMAHGIRKPPTVAWKLYDAARGRVANPLGPYPEVADEVIDAGGSYHYVAKPLSVMLAHLRRRCRSKLPADLKTALQSVKKECDEAEACALSVAFAVQCPAVSDLATLEKELDEAILVSERARELVADRRAELEAR